jgi:hypothetical protein
MHALVQGPCSMSPGLMMSSPLVSKRTGARHADGRLGSLWNRHELDR